MSGLPKSAREPERVDVSLVHPFDPSAPGVGGYDTFLDGFLRHAPAHWTIEVLGLSRDPARHPLVETRTLRLPSRTVRFLPVLGDRDPYRVRALPLSLRFALASRLRPHPGPSGRIVQYQRFESVFAAPRHGGQVGTCFLHNHPPELVDSGSGVRWRLARPLFLPLLRAALRGLEAIWAVDPRTPEWIARTFPELGERCRSLPVWADPTVFHPDDEVTSRAKRRRLRAEFELPADARIILWAGRVERQKDLPTLLTAFARLVESRSDVFLFLVGEGRLQRGLARTAAELGLTERVRWLASRDRSALAELYRAADVAACSSVFESGPRLVYEALACGLPVVSFDVGRVSGPLGRLADLGLLVRQRSAAALARGLEGALALERTPELARRCAAAVAGDTPENALRGVFEVYERWLSSPVRAERPAAVRRSVG